MNKKPDLKTLLEPFFTGETVQEESLFFVKTSVSGAPESSLLFSPEKVLSFQSADGKIKYTEGRDYIIDSAKKLVQLTDNSLIPFKNREELYPKEDSSLTTKISHKRNDPSVFLLFSEGFYFHNCQASISYAHKEKWKGFVPEYAGINLPNTMSKLEKRSPLKLCVSGDSISAGANASKMTRVPPFLPPYPELFANFLKEHFKAPVTLNNFAVGGWRSEDGLKDASKVAGEKPDLTLIAYGMNDAAATTPKAYASNIRGIMEKVNAENPAAEFILIASMLGNKEWAPLAMEKFALFRNELKNLCGKNVILADMTSMWENLLELKNFHALTGNGVNHPNDFGHRIYAQILRALLIKSA